MEMGVLGFLGQGVTRHAAGSAFMVALSQQRQTCGREVTGWPGITGPRPSTFNWRHEMYFCQWKGSRCEAGWQVRSPGWCDQRAAMPSLRLNYSPGVLWQACACPVRAMSTFKRTEQLAATKHMTLRKAHGFLAKAMG